MVEGAGDVGLIEEGDDAVALLEACDSAANLFNGTSTVRAGNDVVLRGERVLALGDDKVTEVERCSID